MCFEIGLRLAFGLAGGACFFSTTSARLLSQDVKIGFGLLQTIYIAILSAYFYFGSKYIGFIEGILECPNEVGLSSCLGLSAAFRYIFPSNFNDNQFLTSSDSALFSSYSIFYSSSDL